MDLQDISSYQTLVLMGRAQRRLKNNIFQKLNDHKLGLVEWSVLGLVHDYSSRGGIKASQLSQLIDVKASLITTTLNVLVLKGYIDRNEDAADKRAKRLIATRSGEKLVSKIEKQLKSEVEKWYGSVDQRNLYGYIKTLQSFANRDN